MNTTTRILFAGVLGAVAMFVWTSLAHMVLPLGDAGVQNTSDDSTLLSELKSTVKNKDGLYIYPSMGLPPDATHEQRSEAMKNFEAKLEKNPSGFFIYHPAGSRPMNMGKFLTIEFITELVEALLAVWLLAQSRMMTFGGRVAFVTAVGIIAGIATNISYWNWWGFPGSYTAAYITIKVVGYFLVGVVAAIMFRRVTTA